MPATSPPAGYGPDWIPPVAEDGSPVDPATGALTLVNNDLAFEAVDADDCGGGSAACDDGAIAGLIGGTINGSIGADATGSAPGAIDMRMDFVMEDTLVRPDVRSLDFGTQALGTVSTPLEIEVSAIGADDIDDVSFFTRGGDDADFWVSAGGCGGTIPAGAPCTVKVRFAPSDAGTRTSTLYVRLTDPATSKRKTIPLTGVTGEAGALPTGPRGDTGDAGPKGDPGAPAPKAHGIKRAKSLVRLAASGRGVVAKVTCNADGCRITGKSARLKIGKKSRKVSVRHGSSIAAGKTGNVSIALNKATRRALKKAGRGTLTLKLTVQGANGHTTTKTIKVKVSAR
jgi:hypothetical protein